MIRWDNTKDQTITSDSHKRNIQPTVSNFTNNKDISKTEVKQVSPITSAPQVIVFAMLNALWAQIYQMISLSDVYDPVTCTEGAILIMKHFYIVLS